MSELEIGLADVSELSKFDQSSLQFNAKKKINTKSSSRFEMLNTKHCHLKQLIYGNFTTIAFLSEDHFFKDVQFTL